MCWMGWVETTNTLTRRINACQENGGFTFTIADKTTDALLGQVGIREETDGLWTLRYWIHPSHEGQGFAPEAVAAICGFAFERRGEAHI